MSRLVNLAFAILLASISFTFIGCPYAQECSDSNPCPASLACLQGADGSRACAVPSGEEGEGEGEEGEGEEGEGEEGEGEGEGEGPNVAIENVPDFVPTGLAFPVTVDAMSECTIFSNNNLEVGPVGATDAGTGSVTLTQTGPHGLVVDCGNGLVSDPAPLVAWTVTDFGLAAAAPFVSGVAQGVTWTVEPNDVELECDVTLTSVDDEFGAAQVTLADATVGALITPVETSLMHLVCNEIEDGLFPQEFGDLTIEVSPTISVTRTVQAAPTPTVTFNVVAPGATTCQLLDDGAAVDLQERGAPGQFEFELSFPQGADESTATLTVSCLNTANPTAVASSGAPIRVRSETSVDVSEFGALTDVDVLLGSIFAFNPSVFFFPDLVDVAGDVTLQCNQPTGLGLVSLEELQRVAGQFQIDNCNTTGLDLVLGGDEPLTLGAIRIANTQIETLDVDSLRAVDGNLAIQTNAALDELTMSSLQSIGGFITITQNNALSCDAVETFICGLGTRPLSGNIANSPNGGGSCPAIPAGCTEQE